jgi:hypothetical protein
MPDILESAGARGVRELAMMSMIEADFPIVRGLTRLRATL